MEERLKIESAAGIAELRLARPDKLNAVDEAMFVALAEAGAALAADKSVRAVVISGEGRGFCAGLDRSLFSPRGAALIGGPKDEYGANLLQRAITIWRRVPAPVIVALHGPVLGAGLQLALSADIRIATPDAELALAEIRWGLVPDLGGVKALAGLVGDDVARDLIYTGRSVSGAEAAGLGLVTRLAADPREAALALAGDLASRSPSAIRAAKRLCNAAIDADMAQMLALECAEQQSLIGEPDQIEAVMSNIQKRKPNFA